MLIANIRYFCDAKVHEKTLDQHPAESAQPEKVQKYGNGETQSAIESSVEASQHDNLCDQHIDAKISMYFDAEFIAKLAHPAKYNYRQRKAGD